MSNKDSYTTAEPLEWHEAISFMNRLYEDGKETDNQNQPFFQTAHKEML